jgi:hypothetical protein
MKKLPDNHQNINQSLLHGTDRTLRRKPLNRRAARLKRECGLSDAYARTLDSLMYGGEE